MATGKKVRLIGGSRDGKQFMIAQVVAEIGFPLPRQGENLHFDKEVYKHVAGSTAGDEPEVYQFDRVDKMPPGVMRPNYPQWFADVCEIIDEKIMIKNRVRLWLSSVWDRAEKSIDAGIPVSYCDEAGADVASKDGFAEYNPDGTYRYVPNGSARITFEIGPFVSAFPMRNSKEPVQPMPVEPEHFYSPSRVPITDDYLINTGFGYHDGKGSNPKRFWQRGRVLVHKNRDHTWTAYVTPDPDTNSLPNVEVRANATRRILEELVMLFEV